MEIIIKSKRPEEMRYPTVGDWRVTNNADGEPIMEVDVCEIEDEFGISQSDEELEAPEFVKEKLFDAMFLVAIHELVEAYLCYSFGIPEEVVTQYDLQHLADEDPGSNYDAPYYDQHELALAIERIVAQAAMVDWEGYNRSLDATAAKVKEALKGRFERHAESNTPDTSS